MKELHYCSRCEKKFVARVVAEVICPRCHATSGVSRLAGAFRSRRLKQLRLAVFLVVVGFAAALYLLREQRMSLARSSILVRLTDQEIERKYLSDIRYLHIYADGLDRAVGVAERSPELFRTTRLTELDLGQRRRLYGIWSSILDYFVALDALKDLYADFWRIHPLERRPAHARAYALTYGAFLVQYHLGMRFLRVTGENATLESMLDEAMPELGIPARAFARLKWRVLHLLEASRVFAGHQYFNVLTDPQAEPVLPDDPDTARLLESEPKWHAAVVEAYKLEATAEQFALNALDILRDETFEKWFPIQKEVAEWMGDTRFVSHHHALISPDQLQELLRHLQPGDILVERRNWFLSNVGLPGFWPHAALYVGDAAQIDAHFDDPDVRRWLSTLPTGAGSLLEHVARAWPDKAARFRRPNPRDGKTIRVIEAISEGVLLNSLEESCGADYVAVLRPRLSKADRAKAILKAFEWVDTPYDFNFDFATDGTIVCSELVWKSYRPEMGKRGLEIPLVEVMGRQTLPANEIVRVFDLQFGTPDQQLDFVWFLDGREGSGKAVVGDLASFRASHRRPKWDILQQ